MTDDHVLPFPHRHEIDHRTIKLVVGVIAVSIAPLTNGFANNSLASISASYFYGGPSQAIFIGFLFAIAALLLAYNGYSRTDMVLSKVAAIAALGVALFPCGCSRDNAPKDNPHYLFAGVMFLILAYFCYGFYDRARKKKTGPAAARAVIYVSCGIAIVGAIVVLAINGLVESGSESPASRITFYGEAVGLIAFGISWLTASRVLPVITSRDERFSPFRATNPA